MTVGMFAHFEGAVDRYYLEPSSSGKFVGRS